MRSIGRKGPPTRPGLLSPWGRYPRGMLHTGLELRVRWEGVSWRSTSIPGVEWSLLAEEPGEGRGAARGATVLIRMAGGVGYPAHRHLGIEEVLVLAGGYRDEAGEYRAGDYVRYPPGSVHAPVALEGQECLLYASARGGIEVLGAPEAPGLPFSEPQEDP